MGTTTALAGSADEARERESVAIARHAPKFTITSVEPLPEAELRAAIERLEAVLDERRANRL